MVKKNLFILPFILLVLLGKPHPQNKFYPGWEGKLEIPGYKNPSLIYVPYNYKKGKRLPLILFMHGAGGRPTSWPWKTATKGKGYIIVGLSYAPLPYAGQRGLGSDPRSIDLMIEYIEKVIDFVDQRLGIDRKHIILSGLSMGGWGVNLYGFTQKVKGVYRAYAILAAGISPNARIDLSVTKNKPVLLLNGEKDPNLPRANQGKPLLEKAGAIVTQVILKGQGHVPSTDSMAKPLAEWLESVREGVAGRKYYNAIQWIDAALTKVSLNNSKNKPNLLDYIKFQDFIKSADKNKPLLLFFPSFGKTKKGKDTKQAKDSAAAMEKAFSYPEGLYTPLIAKEFTCFKVDLTGISRKENSLLNESITPVVVLIDKLRKSIVLIKKDRLRDKSLYNIMLTFLPQNKKDALEKLASKARPLLQELKKLIKQKNTELKKRIKLLKKKRAFKALKNLEKSIEEKTKRIKEILKALKEVK